MFTVLIHMPHVFKNKNNVVDFSIQPLLTYESFLTMNEQLALYSFATGDGSYACDAHLKAPSSLAVAPNGTLYTADLGNNQICSISTNWPQPTAAGMYEIISPVDQEVYLFSHNGTHLHTKHLITGEFLYNFTYLADWHLSAVVSRDGNTFHVQHDSKGIPLWLVAPGGQVYWLTISNSHFLKRASAQDSRHHPNHLSWQHRLAPKTDENEWATVYE